MSDQSEQEKILSITGIAMPRDFAPGSYTAIHLRVANQLTQDSPYFTRFLTSWSAVRYRFAACAHHDEGYTASYRQAGHAPIVSERFIQEREIYDFFVNGQSVLESFCFALFVVGAMLQPADFQVMDPDIERRISPENTTTAFRKVFPTEPLTAVLGSLTKSAEFVGWKKVRNHLAHRAAPGRQIFLTVGAPRRDSNALWMEDIRIDEDLTRSRRA